MGPGADQNVTGAPIPAADRSAADRRQEAERRDGQHDLRSTTAVSAQQRSAIAAAVLAVAEG
jgi:hypothetical protein